MFRFPTKRLSTLARKPVVRHSVIGLAVCLAVYSLIGFLLVPAVIQSRAEKLIAEKLHRPATVGEVRLNPYTLILTLRDVKLTEPEGGAVFAAFDTLTVNLSSQSLLRLAPVVQDIRLSKPYLRIVRIDAHRYNFDDIVQRLAGQPPAEQRARFSLNNIQVEGGRIEFEDRPVRKTHTVADLQLGVPFISSLPADLDVFVEPLLSAKVNDTPVLIKGKARPFAKTRDAVVEFALNGLELDRYLEYLPFQPRFKVSGGRFDARLTASFRQPKDDSPALMLAGSASVKSLRITEPDGKPILALAELSATLGDVDVFSGRFELARVVLNGLQADVSRGHDAQLNLTRLLPPPASGARQAPGRAAESNPFRLALNEVQIRDAAVRYTDERPAGAMRAGVEKFELALRKVAVDTGKRAITIGELTSDSGDFLVRHDNPQAQALNAEAGPETKTDPSPSAQAAAPFQVPFQVRIGRIAVTRWSARLEDHSHAKPAVTKIAPFSLAVQDLSTAPSASARMELKATVNNSGRLALTGDIGLAPLQTDLAVDMQGVDMLPLQPYVTDRFNLRLTRASLSGKGKLQLAVVDGALKGGFKGDMSLDDLATLDKVSTNELMRWKSLSLGGMDLRLQPFALAVDQVALNDFFARLIIDSSGRMNVQDIVRNDAGDRRSLTEVDEDAPVPSRRVRTAELPAPDKPKGKVPPISIRKLVLNGGRVRFTDNFIRPNYSATLTDFGGTVTGLSSAASSSATVDLRGAVNRAPLSVAGRINPLSGNLSLDVKAMVRGMELTSLSAYSSRYVGYGIDKGKLSFEVAYRVENRRLTAENRLILDQLSFGKKSDSPVAMQLPVQFAVALLRDRNGVIDLNVPIEGSLDDPQFSIGGIILKMIGNAIVKAVSQPFAVLGSILGGGSSGELSSIAFDPGRAAILPAGEEKLRSLARALSERPALKLEITGRTAPETDREGLKRAFIERKVRALKFKDLQARGEAAEYSSVVVTPEEYPDLLARVYRDEKFPKPRNVIGLQKNLPVEEMEKLMIANAEVDEEDLITLGNRRAQAAKDWLVKFGQVSGDRLFILASKAEETSGNGAGSARSRVDFSLQ